MHFNSVIIVSLHKYYSFTKHGVVHFPFTSLSWWLNQQQPQCLFFCRVIARLSSIFHLSFAFDVFLSLNLNYIQNIEFREGKGKLPIPAQHYIQQIRFRFEWTRYVLKRGGRKLIAFGHQKIFHSPTVSSVWQCWNCWNEMDSSRSGMECSPPNLN